MSPPKSLAGFRFNRDYQEFALIDPDLGSISRWSDRVPLAFDILESLLLLD